MEKRFYLQVHYHHALTPGEEVWVDVQNLELHPEVVKHLAEMGIVEFREGLIPARQVARLQKIARLRRDLGVNLQGAAVILDLLDRLERLQEELERLRKRFL